MDAIEYLTDQHAQIESLFDQFETAARLKPKLRLWRKLADLLAIHRAVEEKVFYPAVKDAGMEDPHLKAADGHLSTEAIIAELVEADEVDAEVVAKMAILKERKRQHADEEQRGPFSRARELLSRDELECLGRRMEEVADWLMDFTERHLRSAPIARA